MNGGAPDWLFVPSKQLAKRMALESIAYRRAGRRRLDLPLGVSIRLPWQSAERMRLEIAMAIHGSLTSLARALASAGENQQWLVMGDRFCRHGRSGIRQKDLVAILRQDFRFWAGEPTRFLQDELARELRLWLRGRDSVRTPGCYELAYFQGTVVIKPILMEVSEMETLLKEAANG